MGHMFKNTRNEYYVTKTKLHIVTYLRNKTNYYAR